MTVKNQKQTNFQIAASAFLLLIFILLPASSYAAGTVSGVVFENNTTSIPNVTVFFSPNICDDTSAAGSFITGADGFYFGSLAAGSYYVHAVPDNASLYTDKWYDGAEGTDDCNSSTTINVIDSQTTYTDFALSKGSTGTITGTVFGSDVTVSVNAYDGPACDSNRVAGTNTDANGNYSMKVVSGTYYIQTDAPSYSQQSPVNEWWDGNIGTHTYDCNSAAAVQVTADNETSGIDFSLQEGVIISGTVYQSNGTVPTEITLYGGKCFRNHQMRTTADSGRYSVAVPPGAYYVFCDPESTYWAAYLSEWYGDTRDCNAAAMVDVIDGTDRTDVDFSLEPGALISGTVVQGAGSTPIADVCVQANTEPACDHNVVSQVKTATNGYYSMIVPPGTYYVNTNASCSGEQPFTNEWWNDTVDCNGAVPVTVSLAQNAGGINFNLNGGTIISSTIVPGVIVTWTVTPGLHPVGSFISIIVRFSHRVWVSGTPLPQLILIINRTARTGKTATVVADYSSGSGTDALTFLYKVAAGDDVSTMKFADLKLNGALIQDSDGNNVNLTPQSPAPTPSVVNVTSMTESGTYPVGTAMTINIRFNHLVWVKGMPQLVLNTGGSVPGIAYYSSGSGTDTLTFQYTVAAGDDIAKLDYWSQWALELNDGQIYSNQGVDADLDLPAPGEPGSLGYNNALGILGAYYPVYRFYSPILAKYLFTIDENEKEYLIANAADVWQIEGSAYYAYLPSQYDGASRQQRNMLQAVYRFYSEALQTHLFTIDENEKEYLIANAADIWRYEGPAFYVPAGNLEGSIPVYRFYSEDLMVHLFTADENEKNHLVDTAGDIWDFEGVAYYAYP